MAGLTRFGRLRRGLVYLADDEVDVDRWTRTLAPTKCWCGGRHGRRARAKGRRIYVMNRAGLRAGLIVLLVLPSCMPTGPSTLESLESNRALWEERRPEVYEFTLKREPCECPPDWRSPMRVTVHHRLIRSALNVETGLPLPVDSRHAMTIDDLFDLVEHALLENAFRVNVTYDDTFGYPTSIFIDYHANRADDEVGLSAYGLKAVE